jgi:serine/threonine protein phosphatase PrpC
MVTRHRPSAGTIGIELPHGVGRLELSWAAQTDTGLVREQNEDSYLAASPVFAVADGMGGHAAGDQASAAITRRLAQLPPGDFAVVESVQNALRLAGSVIEQIGSRQNGAGAGTTATGIVLTLQSGTPYWAVFNIGDSRVYSLIEGQLSQLTVDHSAVQTMVDSGRLTAQQAENHPDRNIITRAVGFGSDPVPDLWFIPVSQGSRLLVCSDGLTKEVDFELIRMLLSEANDADDAAGLLLEAALAAGGRDNVTTVVVEVVRAPDATDSDSTLPRLD